MKGACALARTDPNTRAANRKTHVLRRTIYVFPSARRKESPNSEAHSRAERRKDKLAQWRKVVSLIQTRADPQTGACAHAQPGQAVPRAVTFAHPLNPHDLFAIQRFLTLGRPYRQRIDAAALEL